MGLLGRLFGGGGNAQIKELMAQGAKVVDVRSPGEFGQGHLPGSENIPLQTLDRAIDKMKKWDKPIVLCCASGIRSGRAVSMLKSKGFSEVYNGGGWQGLKN